MPSVTEAFVTTDKNRQNICSILLALGTMALLQACGPLSPSIPKGGHQAEATNTIYGGSSFSSTSNSDATDTVYYEVVDTVYRGQRVQRHGVQLQRSFIDQYISREVDATIPATHRIDLADESMLDSLRVPGGKISISNSDFSLSTEVEEQLSDNSNIDSGPRLIRVNVIVELSRNNSEVPSTNLLPRAIIHSNQANSSILEISFAPVEDPTAENTMQILSEARRIYIYRLP